MHIPTKYHENWQKIRELWLVKPNLFLKNLAICSDIFQNFQIKVKHTYTD